jgi:hypothetical protein
MVTTTSQDAPADVYYVVETSRGISGTREHRVASPLYETMNMARAKLTRLVAKSDEKAYSVWKGSTYIEPARWAHDVVLEDGSVLRGELVTAITGGQRIPT